MSTNPSDGGESSAGGTHNLGEWSTQLMWARGEKEDVFQATYFLPVLYSDQGRVYEPSRPHKTAS